MSAPAATQSPLVAERSAEDTVSRVLILVVLSLIAVAILTLASYDPEAASRWIMITTIGGGVIAAALLIVAAVLIRREWRRGHADVVRDYRSKPDDTPEIWGSGTNSKLR